MVRVPTLTSLIEAVGGVGILALVFLFGLALGCEGVWQYMRYDDARTFEKVCVEGRVVRTLAGQ